MRHQGRESAFKIIYQVDVGKNDIETALQVTMENDGLNKKEQAFCRDLVLAVEAHLEELDTIIQRNTIGWNVDRMMSIDRNLLRLAVYEMIYCGHIMPEGAINEAVEMAKIYGKAESPRFINSILDKVLKKEERKSHHMPECAEELMQQPEEPWEKPMVVRKEISEQEAETLLEAQELNTVE